MIEIKDNYSDAIVSVDATMVDTVQVRVQVTPDETRFFEYPKQPPQRVIDIDVSLVMLQRKMDELRAERDTITNGTADSS